jgi:hypothetical protein
MYWQLSKAADFQQLPEIGKAGLVPAFLFSGMTRKVAGSC